MKIKTVLTLFVLNLMIAPGAFAKNDQAFKPGASEMFQVLINFLDANADTKFTDYDKKTRKQYEGDIANYLIYAQDYKTKFGGVDIENYTKEDLKKLIGEISQEFNVIEAVLSEFKRAREKKPNKIMNQVLVDFVNMFVLIIKTLEAAVEDETLIIDLRKRVKVVEGEVNMLTGK